MKKFGNPLMVVPRKASALPFHVCARLRPSLPPRMMSNDGLSPIRKPVPMTMVSTSRKAPSAVRTPRSCTSTIPSVTTSTLGDASAG